MDLTLSCLKSKGLTLNWEKSIFSVPELVFFGFQISANGLAPDVNKDEAVKNARPPQNAAEVRSFVGLVNYCAHFIPNFETLAEQRVITPRVAHPQSGCAARSRRMPLISFKMLSAVTVLLHIMIKQQPQS